MKNSIQIFSVLFLFVSCKNVAQRPGSVTEKQTITFPVTINVKEARTNNEIPLLSDFSDDVSYIKLKTPSNIIVKSIRDIQISKDKFFIHEGLSQKVMVFDRDGNFIKQIGRIGRGPNEYINLRSFHVDKNNEDLLLYTGDLGDVFRFNFNGVLLSKLFRVYFDDCMYCLNNILIFSGFEVFDIRNLPDNIAQFATTNMQGQKIDSVLLPIYSIDKWRKKRISFRGNFPSTKFNDILLLYGSGEDTLFHVTGLGNIGPRYIMDFGQYKNPFETRYNLGAPEKLNSYIEAISPPFETTGNLWWKFALNNEAFMLRYDKTKQNAFTFFYKGDKTIDFARGMNSLDELGLVNDIDGGPDFFPEWSVYSDSTQLFISAHEAFDLKKKLTPDYLESRKIKFPDKKVKLLKLVSSLEEKDDYVLMIVKLK